MPIPTLITDLSTTASSNSPAGSDSPATLDDIQRAHASFIAQLRDGKADEADLTAATGASLVGYQPAGGTASTVQSKLRESVSVKDFGAVGDGVTDDTVAIQAAYSYAHTNKKTLRITAGIYKITSALTKPQSFHSVDIVGDGADCTELNYSTAGAISCLVIQGGSGAVTQSKIEGIYFNGNAAAIGIEIIGQCGVIPYRCRFGLNARGIRLHNKNAGEFTEFCVATTCDFTSNCAIALEYIKTLGDASFHGSGMVDCLINAKGGADPAVLVNTGCFVYNAPMSVHLFSPPTGGCNFIYNRNVTGATNNNWYGTLTLEPNPSSNISLAVNDGVFGVARTFLSGAVLSNNQNYSLNDMILVDSLTVNSSGVVNYTPKPYTVVKDNVASAGFVDLKILDTFVGFDSGLLLFVTLIGGNYRYTHSLVMSLDNGAGGGNVVTQIAGLQQFNVSGWGASTFSVNGLNQLVVTNASPGFLVTAYVSVSPVGR